MTRRISVGIIPTSNQITCHVTKDIKGLVIAMMYPRYHFVMDDSYLSLSVIPLITQYGMKPIVFGHGKRPRNNCSMKYYHRLPKAIDVHDFIRKVIDWEWTVNKNEVTFKQLRDHHAFPHQMVNGMGKHERYNVVKLAKNTQSLKLH